MSELIIPPQLTHSKNRLAEHPLFAQLTDLASLRLFMQTHVYAVWDFMSLLKSLQREISCVQVPWRPSSYSKQAVRLINEIVLGEESDIDNEGYATDHFTMYLQAMQEVGASTAPINEFLATLDLKLLPSHVRPFVEYNLELATNGAAHQVAGAFFFGREDLIPSMFSGLLKELDAREMSIPKLRHYLARHIELDGDEHGPLALNMLSELTKGDNELLAQAFNAGLESLRLRKLLWDGALKLVQ